MKLSLTQTIDAITKGTGQGLDDFGIMLDSTGDKTKDFTLLMDALEKKSNSVKNATLSQSEAMRQTGVTFADSMSKIRQSIGEIVVALQPLIGAIADLTSTAAGWISNITDFGSMLKDVYTDVTGSTDDATGRHLVARRTSFEEYRAGKGQDNWAEFLDSQGQFQDKLDKDRAETRGAALAILDATSGMRDGINIVGKLIGAGAGKLKKGDKPKGSGSASESWADVQYERDIEFAQAELDYQIKITAERRAQAELMAEAQIT